MHKYALLCLFLLVSSPANAFTDSLENVGAGWKPSNALNQVNQSNLVYGETGLLEDAVSSPDSRTRYVNTAKESEYLTIAGAIFFGLLLFIFFGVIAGIIGSHYAGKK